MSQPPTILPTSKLPTRLVWTLTLLLVVIGLATVVRRIYELLSPPEHPRFAAGAALGAGFAARPSLTLLHILPAALFIVLMPLQFVSRIRTRHVAWHRWSGRLLIVLGFVVGTSAVVYPAASIPEIARAAGAYIVEVNPERTPLSPACDEVLRGPAGEILPTRAFR